MAREKKHGIGLANTRRRLEQLYGSGQSISLEKLPERGTRVVVTIPLHTARRGFSGGDERGMKPIRVAIADDEPLARERVRSMLEGRERYTIVAECHDGVETAAALAEHDIDLLFLDVQMPGLDGFQILESAGTTRLPIIVFVTAFNDYALRAFTVSALDYLLKPFDRERFEQTLARVEERLAGKQQTEISAELREFLHTLSTTAPPASRSAVSGESERRDLFRASG